MPTRDFLLRLAFLLPGCPITFVFSSFYVFCVFSTHTYIYALKFMCAQPAQLVMHEYARRFVCVIAPSHESPPPSPRLVAGQPLPHNDAPGAAHAITGPTNLSVDIEAWPVGEYLVAIHPDKASTRRGWCGEMRRFLRKARPAYPSPAPYFVPGLPHVMLIELRQALCFRTMITTCSVAHSRRPEPQCPFARRRWRRSGSVSP